MSVAVAQLEDALAQASGGQWQYVNGLPTETGLQFSNGRGTLAHMQLTADGLLVLHLNDREGLSRLSIIPWDDVNAVLPATLH